MQSKATIETHQHQCRAENIRALHALLVVISQTQTHVDPNSVGVVFEDLISKWRSVPAGGSWRKTPTLRFVASHRKELHSQVDAASLMHVALCSRTQDCLCSYRDISYIIGMTATPITENSLFIPITNVIHLALHRFCKVHPECIPANMNSDAFLKQKPEFELLYAEWCNDFIQMYEGVKTTFDEDEIGLDEWHTIFVIRMRKFLEHLCMCEELRDQG